VILKDEPDLRVPKIGQFGWAQGVEIVRAQAYVAARWRFEAAQNVEQRALAAP
jgi:hypothetical protein